MGQKTFFNSDLQLLFSLSHFRDIVLRHPYISNDADPRSAVRHLFQTILGQNCANPVATYPYILQLGLPWYRRGSQFDVQECLSHIINLFFPVVRDPVLGLRVPERTINVFRVFVRATYRFEVRSVGFSLLIVARHRLALN